MFNRYENSKIPFLYIRVKSYIMSTIFHGVEKYGKNKVKKLLLAIGLSIAALLNIILILLTGINIKDKTTAYMVIFSLILLWFNISFIYIRFIRNMDKNRKKAPIYNINKDA